MATATIGQLPLASSVLDEDLVEIELAASGLSKRITRIDLVGASLSGGGIIDTGGFTATIPGNGTVAMLGTANVFTQDNTFADQIAVGQSAVTSGIQIDVTPGANQTLRSRGTGAIMVVLQRTSANSGGGNNYFYKSRGTAIGSEAVVLNGDGVGNIVFGGYDGAAFQDSAFIGGFVDGAPSSGVVPTSLQFWTGDNAAGRAVALTLSSTQIATFSKYFSWAGQKRVSTQFDKTNTTLATVTGLSVDVIAGSTYYFKATLHITADATGGHKVAIAGTATATSIIAQVNSLSNSADAIIIANRLTALGSSAGHAGSTEVYCEIEGTITVNAAGTLLVQFAQNAANGTSSVLVGSTFVVHRIT